MIPPDRPNLPDARIPYDDDGASDAGALRLVSGSSIGISDSAVVTIHGGSSGENLGLYTYRFGAGDITGKSSIYFWTKLKKRTTKWNPEAKKDWMT